MGAYDYYSGLQSLSVTADVPSNGRTPSAEFADLFSQTDSVWTLAANAGPTTTETGTLTVVAADADGNTTALERELRIASARLLPVPACDPDYNDDGWVTFADLSLFKASFGKVDPAIDLNGDGVVSFADLSIFRAYFGQSIR